MASSVTPAPPLASGSTSTSAANANPPARGGSTDWLTLHLPAYNPDITSSHDAAPFGPLPTLDVEALYLASLLKAAHPRHSAHQQVNYRFRPGRAAHAFATSASISIFSSSSSSFTPISIPAQALQTALTAQLDSSLTPQQRATIASIHAYLSTQIKYLILHFQTALPDNWRYVTAEAYAEAHASAAGGESGRGKARGSWSRYFAKAQGIRLAREARLAYVQPQLIRAGLWDLQAIPTEVSSNSEEQDAPLPPTERGSAMHGLNEARSQKFGRGLGGSGRAQAGRAFAVMKLQATARDLLDTLAAFYTPSSSSTSSSAYLFTSQTPTSADIHLFSLLAPVLYPPSTSQAVAGHKEGCWPEPYLADLLRSESSYEPLIRLVDTIGEQLWPAGGRWQAEEQDAEREYEEMLRFTSFERKRESGVGMDQPATVSNFASLLVQGAAQSAKDTAAYVASPFSSNRRTSSSEKKNASVGPKKTTGPPHTSAADSHEAKELAKIHSRRRWWIAGSVFAIVAFVLGSGIVTIEFEDDDDDDDDEGEEEELEEKLLEELQGNGDAVEEGDDAVEEGDRAVEEEREHFVFSTTDEQEEHTADEGFVVEEEEEEDIGLGDDSED